MDKWEKAIRHACKQWDLDPDEIAARMAEGKETIVPVSDLDRVYRLGKTYYEWFRKGYCNGDLCKHKKKSGCFYCELNRYMGILRRGLNHIRHILKRPVI
jgi:hypothetical protein